MAYEEKTGARGLVSVIERVLLFFEKSLPTSTIRYLVVTREVVLDPLGELDRILGNPHDPGRLQGYLQFIENEKAQAREQMMTRGEHYILQFPQIFSPDRIELVVEQHLRTGLAVEAVVDEVILLYNQIRVFETDFHENYHFRIHFDEEAINQIIEEALQRDSTATAVCFGVSRDFDYGFKLIADRSGQTEFTMPRRAVLQPSVYLDELIRESYRSYPLDATEQREKS
jgi:hypothetical protein